MTDEKPKGRTHFNGMGNSGAIAGAPSAEKLAARKQAEAADELKALGLTWHLEKSPVSGEINGIARGSRENLEAAAEIFEGLGYKGAGHGHGRITPWSGHESTMNIYTDAAQFLLGHGLAAVEPHQVLDPEEVVGKRDTLGVITYAKEITARSPLFTDEKSADDHGKGDKGTPVQR